MLPIQGMAITVDSAIVDMQAIGNDPIARLLGPARRASAQFDAAPPATAHPEPVWPDPVKLGRRMAALYAGWERGRTLDLPGLAAALLRSNSIAAEMPLARTCMGAAHAVAAWGGLPYHSAAHHAEVATNAMTLVALADRQGHSWDPRARGLLLAASLSHDLGYTSELARQRFAAEQASATTLDAIAADAGCTAADRQDLRALVLATDPGLRLRPGGPLGAPLDAEAARLLGATHVGPALAALAATLSDADLLSSVGLTVGWYKVQQTRLEREAGRPYGSGETDRFFRDIVGPDFISAPGRVFSANLAAIRGTLNRAA